MSTKKKIMIITAVAVILVATVIIFAIPKDTLLSLFESTEAETTEVVPSATVMPASDEFDYQNLVDKIKAYEGGDKTVFNSEEEYERAKMYVSSYERHEAWFSEEE